MMNGVALFHEENGTYDIQGIDAGMSDDFTAFWIDMTLDELGNTVLVTNQSMSLVRFAANWNDGDAQVTFTSLDDGSGNTAVPTKIYLEAAKGYVMKGREDNRAEVLSALGKIQVGQLATYRVGVVSPTDGVSVSKLDYSVANGQMTVRVIPAEMTDKEQKPPVPAAGLGRF